MAYEDLTDTEKIVFDYIRGDDFVEKPWSTADAAKKLSQIHHIAISEDEIYDALSNIAAKHKNHIHIHYRDGSIRIGAN